MQEKKIRDYLKPYWVSVILAPCLMLLEVFCDLMQPSMLSEIIDNGVISGDIQKVIHSGIYMLLLALMGAVGGIGCTFWSARASHNMSADLRSDLFKTIQGFSFANLDHFHTASLITRLTNDVNQVRELIQMMLQVLVRSPMLFIGGIIMALRLDTQLALVGLAAIPFIAVLLVFLIQKGFPLFSVVQTRLDKLNTIIRENVSGVRVIKAFGRSDYEIERFDKANNDLYAINSRANLIVGTAMPAIMLLMNISIIILLWFSGEKVKNSGLEVGKIMALINYLTQILMSLMMSTMMLMNASRARASSKRIREVLNTVSDIIEPATPRSDSDESAKGLLEFHHVSFHYPSARGSEVLKNLNFRLEPGKTYALMGATGEGKSSLVHLISRFYDPVEGFVSLDGLNIREFSFAQLRSRVGIVLQDSILFSGTLRENLLWGKPEASEEELIQVLKDAQAYDFVSALPQGLETQLGQRGVNFSGGQKQRISLARTLLREPDILILDDSTSALDLETEARLQEALKRRLKGKMLIIIAQRISSIMDADQIIVLEQGKVSAQGTHDELLASNASYQDIYFSQAEAPCQK